VRARQKVPANDAVQRSSPLSVVVSDSACHAGGRGFESRRSRFRTPWKLPSLRCLATCGGRRLGQQKAVAGADLPDRLARMRAPSAQASTRSGTPGRAGEVATVPSASTALAMPHEDPRATALEPSSKGRTPRPPSLPPRHFGSATPRDTLLSLPSASEAAISMRKRLTPFGARRRIAADAFPDAVSPTFDPRKAPLAVTVARYRTGLPGASSAENATRRTYEAAGRRSFVTLVREKAIAGGALS
jgi:hypothetical protein